MEREREMQTCLIKTFVRRFGFRLRRGDQKSAILEDMRSMLNSGVARVAGERSPVLSAFQQAVNETKPFSKLFSGGDRSSVSSNGSNSSASSSSLQSAPSPSYSPRSISAVQPQQQMLLKLVWQICRGHWGIAKLTRGVNPSTAPVGNLDLVQVPVEHSIPRAFQSVLLAPYMFRGSRKSKSVLKKKKGFALSGVLI